MFDNDLSPAQLKAIRRAVRALFFVMYGTNPRITHKVIDDPDEEPRHIIRLLAPATKDRGEVKAAQSAGNRSDCYRGLLDSLTERVAPPFNDYEPDDDAWIVTDEDDDG